MSNLTTGKIVLLIVLILLSLSLTWSFFTHTYIRAEFNKMDPMPSRMGVYYKGYKLGTTSKLKISKDFKTTYLLESEEYNESNWCS